jgi:formate dehydrogenase accessory protein FdhE
VPGGFLDKLFGRTAAPAPEVADALAELARLLDARPSLAAPIRMLHEVLPPLFANPGEDRLPALSAESAAAKIDDGIPLLRGETLELDLAAFRRRWQIVCAAVQRHQNPEAGRGLAQAMEVGKLEPTLLIASVLAAKPDEIHLRADALGLDAGLTSAVLGLVLFPAMGRIAAALAPFRKDTRWEQGFCQTCGSWPLLGEYRGLEQTRYLRCGLCAGEWEFPRLLCPFCSERDHRNLGYFGVEGEESRHRATTCEACRGYVKMTATLAPFSPPALLVADVATVHLDLAAADRGYSSPPVR